jgi:general stress protein 26
MALEWHGGSGNLANDPKRAFRLADSTMKRLTRQEAHSIDANRDRPSLVAGAEASMTSGARNIATVLPLVFATEKLIMTVPDTRKAWEIAENIGVCFLSTGANQYPMAAMVRKDDEAIYFLTDAESEKIAEIGDGKSVQLTFSDTGSNEFLFIEGSAAVSNDRSKISDLWNSFAMAWWDSADDPAIRLITLSPNRAEFWDGPSRLVAAGKMLIAAATGSRPDMGDNRKIPM